MKPGISVDVVNDAEGFEALYPAWNEVLRGSSANSPFLTWEWQYSWWTTCGRRTGLRILAVRMDDELVAIAPLHVTRPRPPWFRVLELMGTGGAGADYLDVIARRGAEGVALRALASSLDEQGLALCMTHLRPDSLAARLAARLHTDGWTSRDSPAGICPYIRLSGHTWDSYLATRRPSHREHVRRRLASVARTFQLRFDLVASHVQRIDALEALEAFHTRRWADRRSSTAFGSRALRAFHRDVTERAFNEGWLRLYTLRLDGEIAAVMYAFLEGRRFYFYQHGFDMGHKRHSLGLVLMGLTVQAAIEEGVGEFDLLWGVESYKWLWADAEHTLGRIDLFPHRFGGRVVQRAMEAEAGLRAVTRRLRARDGHVA